MSVSLLKYVLDLLKEIGMLGCKPANTPMVLRWKKKEIKDSLGRSYISCIRDRHRFLSQCC